MTSDDPRWTVIPPTEEGRYGDLGYGHFRLWEWLADNAPIRDGLPDALCYDGWDGLVAAVHDADTLDKARKVAAIVRPFGNMPGRIDHVALSVLLTLLLPPVSPDTPTP